MRPRSKNRSEVNSVRRLIIRSLVIISLMTALLGDSLASDGFNSTGNKYLGLHFHTIARGGVWPTVPFGTIRLWDTATRWHQLEPKSGHWRFEELDRAVDKAHSRGVDIIFTLGQPPAWAAEDPESESPYAAGASSPPRTISVWERYVSTLARRYQGKIRYWEIWNEADSQRFYSGSYQRLAELEKAAAAQLKIVDPSNIVLSPSFQGGAFGKLERYFEVGGGRYSDVISYHFYTPRDEPEAARALIARVKSIIARFNFDEKPLWNTEVGYLIPNRDGDFGGQRKPAWSHWKALGAGDAKDVVLRSLLVNYSSGVDRVVWYSWDHKAMVLSEAKGSRPKDASRAFDVISRWLSDATNLRCTTNSSIWECKVQSNHGNSSTIAWSASRNEAARLDIGGPARVERTDGVTEQVQNGRVPVGPSPVKITRE